MNEPSPETTAAIPSSNGARLERWLTFLRWSVLALFIWCVKLWVIRHYGDSCPFGDEWTFEADTLLKPAQQHALSLPLMFAPISHEHRIFWTRLFVLEPLQAQRRFGIQAFADGRAGPLCITAPPAITLFLSLCVRGLAAPLRLLFMLATCLLWLLPFGWENTLFGFQSQFYFVILFGIATLWLIWRHDTFSKGWCLGVLVAVAGFFTMASGLFACAMSTGLVLTRLWTNPAHRRRELLGFAALAVVTVVGFRLVPYVPGSNEFRVRTLPELLEAWRIVISWPQVGRWFFLILLAPFVLLGIQVLRRRPPVHDRACLMLALGGWGLLQSIALAYGRGRLTPVAPRYLDVYVLLLCSSFACFCEWYRSSPATPRAPLGLCCGRIVDLLPRARSIDPFHHRHHA